MSTRPQITPFSVITNGDMSQATITSNVTIVQKVSMPSFTVKWSGTSPVGTLNVQVSNDYALGPNGAVSNTGTWETLTTKDPTGALVSNIPISGNTGHHFIDILQTSAYAIRLVYTKTSGTGSLSATVSAKVS